jgi:hypothetical protein
MASVSLWIGRHFLSFKLSDMQLLQFSKALGPYSPIQHGIPGHLHIVK